MVKQKIMLLFCLLMFAVGMNAQNFSGNPIPPSGNFSGRWATTATIKTNSYDAASNRLTIEIDVKGPNSTSIAVGQIMAEVSLDNLPNPVVTINGKTTTKNSYAPIYYIRGDYSNNYTIRIVGTPSSTRAVTGTLRGATTEYENARPQSITYIREPSQTAIEVFNFFGFTGFRNDEATRDTVPPTLTDNQSITVFRGENYPAVVFTARDDKGIRTISADTTPEGGTFTPSISGTSGTLRLSGQVALNPTRSGDKNADTRSTHTIRATDNSNNNAATKTLSVTIRPQTAAYHATAKPRQEYAKGTTAPTAQSLVEISKIASSLSNIPEGARYTFSSVAPNMNQVGEQRLPILITYADGSTDTVTATIFIKDGQAPTVEEKKIIVYRGENYPNTTIRVTDDVSVTNIVISSSPAGGAFSITPAAATRTLTLSGTVPLEPNRAITDKNSRVTTVHTINATDAAGNAGSGNFTVEIRTQMEVYQPNPVINFAVTQGTVVTPAELINNVTKDNFTSTLPNTPTTNPTYSWVSTPITTTTAGEKKGIVRVTYADNSYDDVEVTVRVLAEKPIAIGSEFTVYRGEDYSKVNNEQAFMTGRHATQNITGFSVESSPQYPPGTRVPGTTGNSNAPFRAEINQNPAYMKGRPDIIVSLDAPTGTAQYGYAALTATDKSEIAYIIIHTKEQTEAYDAYGKKNVPVIKGATSLNPGDFIERIQKIASTLPDYPRGVTFAWEVAPDTSKTGKNIPGKVKVIYEDNSYDIVDISIDIEEPVCTKPANRTSAGLNTIVGFSDVGRINTNSSPTSWPMTRKGGWLALESNNKGLIITRMTNVQIGSIVDPQEGMMVYDTVHKCLKIYNGTEWKCFSLPVCPKLDY